MENGSSKSSCECDLVWWRPRSVGCAPVFGASVAIVALLSIIVPSPTPPNPGYVILFWLIPLRCHRASVLAGEDAASIQAHFAP